MFVKFLVLLFSAPHTYFTSSSFPTEKYLSPHLKFLSHMTIQDLVQDKYFLFLF